MRTVSVDLLRLSSEWIVNRGEFLLDEIGALSVRLRTLKSTNKMSQKLEYINGREYLCNRGRPK